jgi:hypothetical protein
MGSMVARWWLDDGSMVARWWLDGGSMVARWWLDGAWLDGSMAYGSIARWLDGSMARWLVCYIFWLDELGRWAVIVTARLCKQ